MRDAFSNTATAWPARASCCAQASPAGPEPTTATRLPLWCDDTSGSIQPSAQPRSTIACSIVLIVTGCSMRFSVHDASHGAGQMRPVKSGKLLVRCSARERRLHVRLIDEVVPVGNEIVDRAGVMAERRAAIHAARALAAQLLVGQRLRELAPVLEALVDRGVGALAPAELEKTGRIAHDVRRLRPRSHRAARWRGRPPASAARRGDTRSASP